MGRLPGTLAFAAVTALLVAVAVLEGIESVEHRDPLKDAIAVVLLGLGGVMAYETIAYASGRAPTISFLAAAEFANQPMIYLAAFAAALLLVGALGAHFTFAGRVMRWWIVAGGGVAYLTGALLTWRTGWVP